ncbi:hypothetical protein F2Q70_00044320 [Brassica cretica]|uniref:Uncharacterized protein n=1 Tax=Brassica cretica TaxID=69181 RepID=A0A8S9KM79_BRACR|nr:hypothetical protein F2Q70_00044320 [Brassica cretica]
MSRPRAGERGGVKLDLREPSWRARDRYAESSRRSRGRHNRRRERRRRRFVDEIERERDGIIEESEGDVDSSTKEREREVTIPPIETPADAVNKEISSPRRDHHFAFGFASREREKTRRL